MGAQSNSSRWHQLTSWPNLFTALRLLAIPVFLWLLFVRDEKGIAAWLLGGLGATDWVDGWMARRFNQQTDFGAMFDPIVDRLLFLVAVPALIFTDTIPSIVAGLIVTREFTVGVLTVINTVRGRRRDQVTWEGKAGTFLLMFALPMYLGSYSELSYAGLLGWLAWVFVVPGIGYAWYSALFQYLPATWAATVQKMQTPNDLRYSSDHEWVKLEADNRIRLGITDYAQDALGDVVYVDLPEVGHQVARGDAFAEVESTKSVSDIYAPVSGTVTEVNAELTESPERLNEDPYGEGWLCVIELSSGEELNELMDSAAYMELTEA